MKENFGIKENTALDIEKECRDSFVWAAFFVEFYREKGRIGELRDVLSNRTEKYIKDLEIRAEGMAIEDVNKILSLLSLVTPVRWGEDKKYFEEIFEESLPEYEYEHLRRIIGLAGETSILLKSDGEYAIKPDPVADYLRAKFMKEEKERFNILVKSLLPYMPFRISYNIGVIPRFEAETREEVFEVLNEIWIKLNNYDTCGQTAEFFSAIVLFTGDFASLPFFDIAKANVSQWIRCYKNLSGTHPEKEVRENLASGLVNATNHYGGADEFEKMEECLKELRELRNDYPEKEVREAFAKGLVNATSDYGRADEFEKMEECLKELRELHNAYLEKEVREEFAKGLVNATRDYGRADEFEKMEECLKELRELHNAYSEKEVRENLASGLVNATNHYGGADEFEKMEECLKELRELHNAYPEKEVREEFAMGLYNATIGYRKGSYENLFLLYKLRFDLPDDAKKERNIKTIEDRFIEVTKGIIEGAYNEGEEHLKEFINLMKAEIREQTELELLIGKAHHIVHHFI